MQTGQVKSQIRSVIKFHLGMHAYLVVGPQQERKKQVEDILAKAKITKTSQTLFDTQTSHSIELIRTIERQLKLKEGRRAVIIENAQKLTPAAANAFLKTLEEPPGDTLIVLSSPTALLPGTILSRCFLVQAWGKQKTNQEFLKAQKKLFAKITRAKVGERIELAESLGKSKQEAVTFCQEQLLFLRQLLVQPQKKKKGELLGLARAVLWTLEQLEGNVNPKMLLFELIMGYPKGVPKLATSL